MGPGCVVKPCSGRSQNYHFREVKLLMPAILSFLFFFTVLGASAIIVRRVWEVCFAVPASETFVFSPLLFVAVSRVSRVLVSQ